MTKIKARFYAAALWDLTAGKTGEDLKEATISMLKLLQKNKQLKLWPQVLEAYRKLVTEKEGVILARVKSDQALNEVEAAKITDFLKKETGAKTVELLTVTEKVGPGLIVETDERRWDLTLAKQLENFKEQLVS